MIPQVVSSACPHDCPSTCALEVELIDPRTIGKIHGSSANPYTDGVICAKVQRYAERVHHPDRLTRPLRRRGAKGEGRFDPISWDDALDMVADAFARTATRHRPSAIWPYLYAGTMGLVQRDGIERLRNVMGYSGMGRTICSTIARAGWTAGAGAVRGVDPREMADSDLIVLWGCNAAATQVHVLTHATKARKTRGAKIVAIDPYANATARSADIHLALKPGTDGALACGVMHVLFAEGYADHGYMKRYTDVPDDLERHLRERTPAWAAEITGLAETEIVEFARLYGGTPRSFLRLGYGFTRSRNGAANMHAAACLPAVTGAWKHKGGGALFSNGALYPLDWTIIEGLDAKQADVRILDMSRIGPILTGDKGDLGDGPPVMAMLIQNTNPVNVAPESNKVRAGLARDDLFVCVHEQFMTETARMADVVLPATTFLEHDDIYLGGGHTFLQVARGVLEPPAECRSNHAVICALAKRLNAKHRGFEMTAWELIDATLAASNLPDAASVARSGGLDRSLPFDQAHFLDGFGWTDGRFRFKPNWADLGPRAEKMPALPDHMTFIEDVNDTHPYRLITPPAQNFLNSSFTETPSSRKREGRPTAFIHPRDCSALGVEDGSRVRLGNTRGSVVVHAMPLEGLRPGVVAVEGIWPDAAFVEGVGINALVGADAVPPAGGAAFHDTAVWIRVEGNGETP